MSGVPDVQEALVGLLAADVAFADVLVRFAPPLKKVEERERVYVIDEDGYTLGGGEQGREELFGARLVVEVFDSGDNPKRASDRRWELIQAIDAALIADDFHGYYTEGRTLGVESSLFTPDEKNYVARSVVTIDIEDRV